MGDRVFYGRLDFASPEAAEAAKLKALYWLQEMTDAWDFWQDGRDLSGETDICEFWNAFHDKFPEIYQMLEGVNLVEGDCNNALAGHLLAFTPDECDVVEAVGNTVQIAVEVWQFTEFEPIMDALEKETGAAACYWCDEYEIVDFVFELLPTLTTKMKANLEQAREEEKKQLVAVVKIIDEELKTEDPDAQHFTNYRLT